MNDHQPINEAALRERLKEDFPFYAERCLRIRPKEGPIIPLRLNWVQREVHAQIEGQRRRTGMVRALILKCRQPGISTYVEGRFYQQVTHRFGVKAFILTHHTDATDNLFAMTERYHSHCPDPVKPLTGAANAKELHFDRLESSFEVGTARTSGVGRSDTIQLLHGSEVAFWENADQHVDGLLQAVPQVKGTEVILESTANGPVGVFYNMCKAAERGEGDYILVFVPWFLHDEYMTDPPSDWEMPDEFRDYQELHSLSTAQMYWAWKKNLEMVAPIGGSTFQIHSKFRQEYPATAQEAFQTTTENVLIQPECVLRARQNTLQTWKGVPLILGLDIARGGKDKTHLIDRQGRIAGRHINEARDTPDLMKMVGWVSEWIVKLDADHLFIDATEMGGGSVYDRLLELGFDRISAVDFGSKAQDFEKYGNKRAEMWARLNIWLVDEVGADLPDLDVVSTQLCAPTIDHDSNGRLLIERKKDIKKRLKMSPDFGDALALTFAEHVEPRTEEGYSGVSEDEVEVYDTPEF